MKQFSIVRYLKRFKWLIFVLAAIGAAAVFIYAVNKQTYTASMVIRYTGGEIPEDLREIYSPNIIDAALVELGIDADIDGVRSRFRVESVIPEKDQVMIDALLAKGTQPDYETDTYRISYTDSNRENARDILDAVVKNYYSVYTEGFSKTQIPENAVDDLPDSGNDYLECAEVLETAMSDMLNFLSRKRKDQKNVRSIRTGCSYDDLYEAFESMYRHDLPLLYVEIVSTANARDLEVMRTSLRKEINDLYRHLGHLQQQIDLLNVLLENYIDQTKEISDYNREDANSQTSEADNVLDGVQSVTGTGRKKTTYDELMDQYVSLRTEYDQTEVDIAHKEFLLDAFNSNAGVDMSVEMPEDPSLLLDELQALAKKDEPAAEVTAGEEGADEAPEEEDGAAVQADAAAAANEKTTGNAPDAATDKATDAAATEKAADKATNAAGTVKTADTAAAEGTENVTGQAEDAAAADDATADQPAEEVSEEVTKEDKATDTKKTAIPTRAVTSQEIEEHIDEIIGMFNEYYAIADKTCRELNSVLSAQYFTTVSSISVYESIQLVRYVIMALFLFLFVGVVFSVMLGRGLELMEGALYIDRMTDLPNRARCDMFIGDRSKALLPENYCCIVWNLHLNSISERFGRNAGDEVLSDFAQILKSFREAYGFIAHNGGGQFFSFFENCSQTRLEAILKTMEEETDKYNRIKGDDLMIYSVGSAITSSDEEYQLRPLLRLAVKRQFAENEAAAKD